MGLRSRQHDASRRGAAHRGEAASARSQLHGVTIERRSGGLIEKEVQRHPSVALAEAVAELREQALVELGELRCRRLRPLARTPRSAARSLWSSRVGVTTCTPTRRSPRCDPRSGVMPRPLIVRTSPAWMPGRTSSSTGPSRDSIVVVVPRIASGIETSQGGEQVVALPAEDLVGRDGHLEVQVAVRAAGGTDLAGARAAAGADRSRRRPGCRSTPCGERARGPDPGRSRRGTGWSCRSPGTMPQGWLVTTLPRRLRTWRWTCPAPWQMSQVTGEVPGWQQDPVHVSHRTAVSTSSSRCVAEDDVLELERDADERVLAALAPRARPPGSSAARCAEERLEDVAEAAEALGAARPAERRVAHVVARALLRVAQHVVRVRHELEPLRRVGARVHVRVQLAREAPVRLLDLIRRRVARDAENLIVVSHNRLPARALRGIVWSYRQRVCSSSRIRLRYRATARTAARLVG